MKVLHIDSSITGEASLTRQLSSALVEALWERVPDLKVARRDLDADPIAHLDSQALAGGGTDSDAAVLEEFLDADVIVVGAPMYNFSISSQLKAWVDRLLVRGKTFRYGANGSEGLAGGRTLIIASSRGGLYETGTPQSAADFQEPYLRCVFSFIGVNDVRFVRAEGVSFGPDQRADAMNAALAEAATLAEGLAAQRLAA